MLWSSIRAYEPPVHFAGVLRELAVPMWGLTTYNLSGLFPKRDDSPKRVNVGKTRAASWLTVSRRLVGYLVDTLAKALVGLSMSRRLWFLL